jgi:hypothetical protein
MDRQQGDQRGGDGVGPLGSLFQRTTAAMAAPTSIPDQGLEVSLQVLPAHRIRKPRPPPSAAPKTIPAKRHSQAMRPP